MRENSPPQIFRRDFDMILIEAKRQEQLHPANKGEYDLAKELHVYFDQVVVPLIKNDPWVFEAASRFASEYVLDCFRCWRLGNEEIVKQQQRLHDQQRIIKDLLARAYRAGGVTSQTRASLERATQQLLAVKGSDLLDLLDLSKLSRKMQAEAHRLVAEARDHEPLQLLASLRAFRDAYETVLPRLMYVVRRAIKVELGLPKTRSDTRLLNPSQSLSWYKDHLPNGHALHPLLVTLADYYKRVRNVSSHHQGFSWHPESNQVWLYDPPKPLLKVDVYEFQQRYRYLVVYLCDYGTRGVLAAYCECERGLITDRLLKEYEKTFPEESL